MNSLFRSLRRPHRSAQCPRQIVVGTISRRGAEGERRAWSDARRSFHFGGMLNTQRKVNPNGPSYRVNWILKDGSTKTTVDPEGLSLLDIAHKHDIDLEGACEQSLACSTCHVVVIDQAMYDKLPEPVEEEEDMLDLAFGLTSTSRLGCQIILAKDIDGITVKLPSATRNMYADGHKPKPH